MLEGRLALPLPIWRILDPGNAFELKQGIAALELSRSASGPPATAAEEGRM